MDRHVQATAAGVAAGGATGGATGLTAGTAMGAAIGASAGLTVGAATGAIGGGAVGYSTYAKRSEIKEFGEGAMKKASSGVDLVKGRAAASAGYLDDKASVARERFVGKKNA